MSLEQQVKIEVRLYDATQWKLKDKLKLKLGADANATMEEVKDK